MFNRLIFEIYLLVLEGGGSRVEAAIA